MTFAAPLQQDLWPVAAASGACRQYGVMPQPVTAVPDGTETRVNNNGTYMAGLIMYGRDGDLPKYCDYCGNF